MKKTIAFVLALLLFVPGAFAQEEKGLLAPLCALKRI